MLVSITSYIKNIQLKLKDLQTMQAVLTGPSFVALAPVTPGVNVVDDAKSPV